MRPLTAFLLAVSLVSTFTDTAAQRDGGTIGGVVPGQPVQAPPNPGGPALPPRDPRQTQGQATGTGIVRGRVVSAENRQPIRRARVTIFAPELRESRAALTDDQGLFELKELPPGRYTLNATKGGYVSVSFGQRRLAEVPRPLQLADKQVLDKIDFTLPRGGVVTGRVLDEFGEPLTEVMVQVSRFRYVGGQRRLFVAGGRPMQTDDLGQFRVYGLPPGEYYVSAGMMPGMTDDVRGISTGYATTYYPGTPSLSEAQRVPVAVGQETSGIVFSLSAARTSKIRGRVLNSEGKPVGGVFLTVRPQAPETGMLLGMGGARTRPDGSFELSNITPGDYAIEARPMSSGPSPMMEMAWVNVTVSGEDIAGLTLVMSKGGVARGQILFDDGKVPQGLRPSEVRVFANPLSPFGGMMMPGQGGVKEDWNFEITGVIGERLIRAQAPPGWALKSVVYDGTDVTDRAIDFGTNGELAGIQVVLTERQTTLSGSVLDPRGNVLKDYVVVVFAEDDVHWVPQTRFIRTGRPDQDGRFTIRGLPPERYLAVAVEYLEPGEETNPDTLEQLKALATSLSLTEGENRTADLKLSAY